MKAHEEIVNIKLNDTQMRENFKQCYAHSAKKSS